MLGTIKRSEHLFAKLYERVILDALANAVNKTDREVYVVDRGEGGTQHFFRFKQVVDIRGRVIRAGVAIACSVEWLKLPALR